MKKNKNCSGFEYQLIKLFEISQSLLEVGIARQSKSYKINKRLILPTLFNPQIFNCLHESPIYRTRDINVPLTRGSLDQIYDEYLMKMTVSSHIKSSI